MQQHSIGLLAVTIGLIGLLGACAPSSERISQFRDGEMFSAVPPAFAGNLRVISSGELGWHE